MGLFMGLRCGRRSKQPLRTERPAAACGEELKSRWQEVGIYDPERSGSLVRRSAAIELLGAQHLLGNLFGQVRIINQVLSSLFLTLS